MPASTPAKMPAPAWSSKPEPGTFKPPLTATGQSTGCPVLYRSLSTRKHNFTSHQIRQGFLVKHTLAAGNQCSHQLAKLRFHATLRTIDLVIIMAQSHQDLIERNLIQGPARHQLSPFPAGTLQQFMGAELVDNPAANFRWQGNLLIHLLDTQRLPLVERPADPIHDLQPGILFHLGAGMDLIAFGDLL